MPAEFGGNMDAPEVSKGNTLYLPVSVAGAHTFPKVGFATDIVPLLTKNGCNAGACHGAAAGQNGFKLSLRGYDPAADYEQIRNALSCAGFELYELSNWARPGFQSAHNLTYWRNSEYLGLGAGGAGNGIRRGPQPGRRQMETDGPDVHLGGDRPTPGEEARLLEREAMKPA